MDENTINIKDENTINIKDENTINKLLAKSIGKAAREARKALKLTQEDAADRIKVSVEFYARIERGNSLPSILTFARIVSALGVSADLLLGRQPVITHHVVESTTWTAEPPTDSPEIRRLVRRLRKARSSTVRLVNLMVKELEREPSNEQALAGELPSAQVANGEAMIADEVPSVAQAAVNE